jgi:hypothetical protein
MSADIQHKQTHAASSGFAYEAGGLVPVVMPEDHEVESAANPRADVMQGIMNFIELMTRNATSLQTGQRVHLLAYQLGLKSFKTHAEFARQLKVTPGRVSQIIREMPSELNALACLKSRAAKGRGLSG